MVDQMRIATTAPGEFVKTQGSRFVINGAPFRFVGANVAVMYRDEDRAAMPETLRQASQAGIRVVRVWAFGEGGPNDVGPLADFADWPRTHPFRWAPNQWNEEAFVHLDKVLVAAQDQQSARATLPNKLVARHGRCNAVLAMGRDQRCRR